MVRDERSLRRLLCDTGRWLDQRGYVVATDGNLSVRMGENDYLMTFADSRLGAMSPEDIVLTDAGGVPRRSAQTPTSEWRLHLLCYRSRPEVRAVIHAHPPWCLAASTAGIPLSRPVLPEVVFTLGSVPTAPYAIPATQQSADALAGLIGVHDAILLDHHGSVTVGVDMDRAMMNLERMELLARVLVTSAPAGVLRLLSRREVEEIRQRRAEAGMNPDALLPDPSWAEDDLAAPPPSQ